MRQVKFNAFLHPNDPERIYLYLARQFEAELIKIGQFFTKSSFIRMVKKINAFNESCSPNLIFK